MAFALPAAAADGSASAGWGLRLDDHRALAVAPGSSPARFTPWTQAITPAFELVARPLGVQLDAAGTGRIEMGASVPGEGVGPVRRGTAAEANAALERSFAAGLLLAARGSVARSNDLLDVDHATVSADADAARWAAAVRGESRRLEGEWHVRGWRSNDANPVESRSFGWGARAYALRPASGAVFVGAHERRMDRDRLLLLRARTAALGLRRDLLPGLAATLELGAVDERIGADHPAPRGAAALELASPPDGATQVRMRLARELGPEFELEMTRSRGRARAWVRASSTVDIEGSSSATPAVIQRATIGAGDTLAAANVLNVEASLARSRSYRGLPLEGVAAVRVGAWLERRVQPWLSCRAGWDLLVRDGNEVGTKPAFRRSRFELQVQAHAR
jgi:hypothetical protein